MKIIIFFMLAVLLLAQNALAGHRMVIARRNSGPVPQYRSNGDIDQEDFANLTAWTDNDTGTCVSSATTFDSASALHQDTNTSSGGFTNAKITQDLGTFGERLVCTAKVYEYDIGASNTNCHHLAFDNGTTLAEIELCNDGIKYNNSGLWSEVGTNVNFTCSGTPEGCWQIITMDINYTAETLDLYVNDVLVGDDLDISTASTAVDGTAYIKTWGFNNDDMMTYVDYLHCGSDFQ